MNNFYTYANILPHGLTSVSKIFADDISIFSKAFDEKSSQRDLNSDLAITCEWALRWRMHFNPDP